MGLSSHSSVEMPEPSSRHLYAGHHLHSIRNTPASSSRGWYTPSVLMSHIVFGTSSRVRFNSPLNITPVCFFLAAF
jgi:hypothetical protein